EFIGLESRPSSRPDVAEARVVVAGGRAFRTTEEFERYVGGLADALGGGTGCTRALVDAGIAPNEWQVGQTGKIVAPELYVALGAVDVLILGVRRRARLWRLGKPIAGPPGWRAAVANVLRYVLLQGRVRGRGLASTAHALLFGGFCVLFIGTLLVGIEHALA